MNIFSIENQYQLYLKRINLPEEQMHPKQKEQLKFTFYAAVGQTLLMLRDDTSALPEGEAVEKLQGMIDEADAFFRK